MSRKRKFEWLWNGRFHEQVPITQPTAEADMAKRNKHYGNPPPFNYSRMDDEELLALFNQPKVEEVDLSRANIRIYRNHVMEALEKMLRKYTEKSQRELRREFVDALDTVIEGYQGEIALNGLLKRGNKHDRTRSALPASRG